MTIKQITLVGFAVAISVPSTAVEFNQMAKAKDGEDLCCKEAVNNVIYRSTAAGIRADICDAVEALTGIGRKTEKKELKTKNDDGTPRYSEVYSESEEAYINRVLASGWTREQFADIVAKAVADNPFDPSMAEPKAKGPKKAQKSLISVAEEIIGKGKGEQLASILSTKLGHPVAADANSLALAIAEDRQREEEAKKKALFADLGITV